VYFSGFSIRYKVLLISPKNNARVTLLMHTSLMGALGLGLSGLWGLLVGDGGGDCSFGDGDLANEVGPIPENKNKAVTQ